MVARGAEYERRARDYYRTPERVTESILKIVRFRSSLCDPCCGNGAMLNVFRKHGYAAFGCDIHPVGVRGAKTVDFVNDPFPFLLQEPDICTNPPYGDKRASLAVAFIRKSLDLTRNWNGKVAMLLPVDFDSAVTRTDIFRDHPAFAMKIVLLYRIKWFDRPAVCRPCDGTGRVGKDVCPRCDGAGEKESSPATNHAVYVWDWKRSGPPTLTYAE